MPVGRLVRTGLVGGIAVIYVALVGLLAKVAEINLIGTQVTGARAVLVFVPFLVAYVAVRPRVVAGEIVVATTSSAARSGAVAGLASGGSVAVALLFTNWYGVDRVGEIFIQVNPALLEILSFGKSVTVGAVILTVGGVLAGAAGGAFRTLAVSVRRPLATAMCVTLLAGLLQRIIPIALVQLGITVDWLYSPASGGLTWLGAALFFAGSLLCSWAWARRGKAASATVRTMVREQPGTRIIVLLITVGVLATIPLLVGAVISEVLGTVMVFMLLGLGLNIVVGYAGLLDLGYVAFFGFGAYATALLTGATLNTTTGSAAPAFTMDLNFYVAIPIIVLLAAGVGVLIGAPVLRLRGDYLAIVTLGLGEMVTILISSNWLKPLVGGPQGMRNITDAELAGFSFRDPQHFFYLALAFVLFAIFLSWRLANSRIGRAWNAMREDEQVADAMGISTTRFKLLAFATGGAVGALGGALFAVKIGSLTPSSFEIIVSITALAIVILGGMGSIPGVVVGALVLIGLPGLLREFEEYRQLIYGAALVSIMILRPQGLVPNIRRSRELHEEDRSQDKWAGDLAADEDVAAGISPIGEGERMTEPLLEIKGVRKQFGGLSALAGLDMHIDPGEILSVIGPNGAGKSTLFNVITGLYAPDGGDITFRGDSIVGLRPHQVARLGIARTFQNVHLFPNMTVLENAMVGQHCRSKSGIFGSVLRLPSTRREEERIRIRAQEALDFFGSRLAGYRQEQPAFSLSYANRRRLEMARAMATDPTILLLDEPTAGMNPRETLELRDHIVRMRDEVGLTVLVIEHDMRVVKGVSDRVIACDYGQKIGEGTYEEVANNEQVIEAYLGTKATG